MNIIPSPVSASLSGPVAAGASAGTSADDSTGLPFRNLLPENPDCSRKQQDDRDAGQSAADEESPTPTDPALFGLLPFLPAPVAPPPPPEAPPVSAENGCIVPADVGPARANSALANGSGTNGVNAPGNSFTPSQLPNASSKGQSAGVVAHTLESSAVAAGEWTWSAAKAGSGGVETATTGVDTDSVPSSNLPTDPCGTPGTESPANFSRETLAVMAEHPLEKMQVPRMQGQTAGQRSDGTPAAMQRRVMPEVINEQYLRPKANGAGDAFVSSVVTSARLSLAEEKSRESGRRESAQSLPSPSVTLSGAPSRILDIASFPHAEPQHDVGSAGFRAAAHCIEQTMDLAEQIHAKGNDRVEVQMHLPDGHKVTVSLRLENGEWKPVFKTDTDALCQVLEQSWEQSAAQPASRTVRFGAPVFESLQSHADPGGGMHQRSDARERSFTHREQETRIPPVPARNRAAAGASKQARPGASSGVHLYA